MKEPKIRFKGFSGEWKRSTLGDLALFSKGSGYSKSDICKEGTPVILYGRMYTKYQSVFDEIDTFVTPKDNSVVSKGGEVIIPGSGESSEDISLAAMVKNDGVILGGDLNILKFNQKVNDPAFMSMAITYSPTRAELSSYSQGKTVVHLRNSEIAKGTIRYPNISEQNTIVNYVLSLDAQISASTSRLASLKQMKAASLQAMFPQEGETVPKVRFKGFEGEWKKVKFDKAFSFLKNNSLSRAELCNDGDIINIHYGDVLIKYGDILDIGNDEVIYVADSNVANKLYTDCPIVNGDIIIADAAEDFTVGKCVEVQNVTKQKIVSGLHTIPCRPLESTAPNFWGYYINSNSFHRQLLPMIQGSKISSISKTSLSATYVVFPVVEEQQSIASFFTSLDRQITLHAQRLEKLKQIKAACLDKMFV